MTTEQLPENHMDLKSSMKERLIFLSGVASLLVIFIGILVLSGWLLEIETIKRVGVSYVAMNPLTAVCFILCGTAMWLLKHPSQTHMWFSKIISFAVLLICMLKFISFFISWDYPLDRLLFQHQLREESFNLYNRMAPNAAFCFILASLAIILIDVETSRKQRPAQFLCILITLISLLSLYGYVYGVKYLISIGTYIPIALHAALTFLILAVGLLFSRPDKGSMLFIFCQDTGKNLFLRLTAIGLPLLLGWLQLQGEYAGYYSTEFGTALFAVFTYMISMFLLGRNALERYRTSKERYRANMGFLENAQKLQSILDNTATPVYIKDKYGNFALVNAEFERMFNMTAEEVMGKTAMEIFPSEIASTIEEHDREVLESGETIYVEEVFRLPQGLRTYLSVKFPIKDMEGHLKAMCCIATDITERKKTEKQLRESEHRLMTILTSLGEGVVVSDACGKFIYSNARAEEILGQAITDTPLAEWSSRFKLFRPDGKTLFPPEELPLAMALQGKSSDKVEMLIKNKKFPKGRLISVTGRPVTDEEGNITAGVVDFRDITEAKRNRINAEEASGEL